MSNNKRAKTEHPYSATKVAETTNWWENKDLLAALAASDNALETSVDKGITIDSLKDSIAGLRQEKYGK